ncbi:hypothetical protein TNIN_498981 [Trichonephila inaurata madagascariensis]|uniref:Uncharacterized protein n=1 Tax=Trichonephila inaurata madagascariensis TaxID=2747483 RepID=A0A8X7BQ26_9ARAC|nr:hypothetical protein TNIN_498981 [Trichonephila inaurata madagascariensis]
MLMASCGRSFKAQPPISPTMQDPISLDYLHGDDTVLSGWNRCTERAPIFGLLTKTKDCIAFPVLGWLNIGILPSRIVHEYLSWQSSQSPFGVALWGQLTPVSVDGNQWKQQAKRIPLSIMQILLRDSKRVQKSDNNLKRSSDG